VCRNKDCIELLEELIELPKRISGTDLGELCKIPEYIRKMYLEDLKKRQQEYYLNFISECRKDDYLSGYIYLAMLKLAICFKKCGNTVSLDFVDEHMEKSMKLIQDLEEDLPVIRRLKDPEKIADYYYGKIIKGEAGFFRLILDAIRKKKDPLDEILEMPEIPDSLAKAIYRLYKEDLELMSEAAKAYIDKYGLPEIKYELDLVLEKAKKDRETLEKKIDEEYERKLEEVYAKLNYIENEKATIEKKLIQLEEELARKGEDIKKLETEREEIEKKYMRVLESYEETLKEQEKTIDELKNEIGRLESVKAELEKVKAESVKTEEEKRRIAEELRRIEKLYNSLKESVEELSKESGEIKSKKMELEAIVKSLKEEDTFFDGVTSEKARLMEIDYAKNVEKKLKEAGWRVKIDDKRNAIYEELKELNPDIDYNSLIRIPNNVIILATKGFLRKQIFEIKILSHYKELYFAGVDKRKFSLMEIMPYIEQLREKDRYVLALASTTGWSSRAIDYVVDSQCNLILVDLRNGEIYYNPVNSELRDYVCCLKLSN